MTLKTICKLAHFMLTVIVVQLPDLGREKKQQDALCKLQLEKFCWATFCGILFLFDSLTGTVPAFQLPFQNRHYFIGNCTQAKQNKITFDLRSI